jgi:hypothetical protein
LQEIRAHLPPGRYAIVISTNYGDQVFGVIPPQRNYIADVALLVRTPLQTLIQETNAHYAVLTLRKRDAGDVYFIAQVQKLTNDERVVLHVGRAF